MTQLTVRISTLQPAAWHARLGMETLLHREKMENFIHRENMAIFKKRLAETKDATIRAVLQQLLTAEQAKDVTPKSEK